ncbi:hypothetical protein [Streptomyces sp. AK04-3B]|nr:hypothetical protein [Streptomyces sp. AK04-3B]MDX3797307.1 hypothetical protein [Streptomyces sp. AK04-3B]
MTPRPDDALRAGLPALPLRRVRGRRVRALDSLVRSARSRPRSVL